MVEQAMPRISIGMPVYNGARHIREALDSLLGQTFSDLELIIGDNASTDDTEAICREYAARDSRIRYIRHEKNIGAIKNFDFVYRQSRGQYFKWAAHDDKIAPTFLERCAEVLDRDPEVVLCYARVTHIDAQSQSISDYDSGFHLVSESPVERFRAFFKAPVKCTPIFGLMRSKAIRTLGPQGDYIAADRIYLGELALMGKIHEVPENLFFRRIHPGMSTEANKNSRSLAMWFNPANQRRILLPKWKWLKEYLRGVNRARLTSAERRQCLLIVLQNLLPPRKWPAMAKELAQGIVQVAAHPDWLFKREVLKTQ